MPFAVKIDDAAISILVHDISPAEEKGAPVTARDAGGNVSDALFGLRIEERGDFHVETETDLGAGRITSSATDADRHRMTGMFEPEQVVGAHRFLDIDDGLVELGNVRAALHWAMRPEGDRRLAILDKISNDQPHYQTLVGQYQQQQFRFQMHRQYHHY